MNSIFNKKTLAVGCTTVLVLAVLFGISTKVQAQYDDYGYSGGGSDYSSSYADSSYYGGGSDYTSSYSDPGYYGGGSDYTSGYDSSYNSYGSPYNSGYSSSYGSSAGCCTGYSSGYMYNSPCCTNSYYGTPTYNYSSGHLPPTAPAYEPLKVSCYPTPLSAHVGEAIQWVTSAYGGNGAYNYTWTGDEGLSGYGSAISKTYYNAGNKSASVRVISDGQSVSINCAGTVIVYGNTPTYTPPPVYYPPVVYTPPTVVYQQPVYQQPVYHQPVLIAVPTPVPAPIIVVRNALDIGCFADPAKVSINQPTTWSAEVTGDLGPFLFSWSGSDGLSGNQISVTKFYEKSGEKSAVVTITSADGKTGARACTNTVTVKSAAKVYKPAVKPTVTVQPAPAPVPPPPPQSTGLTANSVFSLQNVPWGWVALLVILILFGTVLYLLFNRQQI